MNCRTLYNKRILIGIAGTVGLATATYLYWFITRSTWVDVLALTSLFFIGVSIIWDKE